MTSLTREQVSIPTTIVINSSASSFSPQHVQLALDEEEQRLFKILTAALQAFEQGAIVVDGQPPRSLEIRVAGGWVRDKLLGLSTHDVDIAVDHLTGVSLATVVQAYLHQHHDNGTCGRMGVIAANPAQSKHLETATMRVCGIEVDFTNLRAQEVYTDHSRIPEVRFGTPQEDALRRDFTVNALFYNLRSKMVEDWTRRGIADLQVGCLVAPLEPVQTFRDDPLRVLRAIRFAVRYSFGLDPALQQACMLEEIHKALHIKVSRERVGKELEGMLSGKGANPLAALQTIARLKLAGSVFCLPVVGQDNVESIDGDILGQPYITDHDSPAARHLRERGWEESLVLLDCLPKVLEAWKQVAQPSATSVDERLLPVAVFLLPFRHLTYRDVKKGDKDFSIAAWIFREGIKFKNKDVASITVLMETIDDMVRLLTESATTQTSCRLGAGLLLRSTKDFWVTSLLLAAVIKLRQAQHENGNKTEWTQAAMDLYQSILALDLDRSWTMRPLLDGKALIQALSLPRGPEVGTYLDEQVRWMLLNPRGTRDQCEAHLLSVKRSREQDEMNDSHHGMSDGTGLTPSSPVQGGKSVRHFSKKMHVESMDMS